MKDISMKIFDMEELFAIVKMFDSSIDQITNYGQLMMVIGRFIREKYNILRVAVTSNEYTYRKYASNNEDDFSGELITGMIFEVDNLKRIIDELSVTNRKYYSDETYPEYCFDTTLHAADLAIKFIINDMKRGDKDYKKLLNRLSTVVLQKIILRLKHFENEFTDSVRSDCGGIVYEFGNI